MLTAAMILVREVSYTTCSDYCAIWLSIANDASMFWDLWLHEFHPVLKHCHFVFITR